MLLVVAESDVADVSADAVVYVVAFVVVVGM